MLVDLYPVDLRSIWSSIELYLIGNRIKHVGDILVGCNQFNIFNFRSRGQRSASLKNIGGELFSRS